MSLVGVKLTTSEWERRTARMQAHALDEGQSAIGEVYEAAPRPRWTPSPPRDIGLYFVRLLGGTCRVVEVYRNKGRLMACWTDVPEFEVASSGLEWGSEPIREPA